MQLIHENNYKSTLTTKDKQSAELMGIFNKSAHNLLGFCCIYTKQY